MLLKKSYIIVGLSGGVDSSVALYLLKQAGHKVHAVFMKNWEEDDTDHYCASANDIADAQTVCQMLDVELQIVNFANDYWERVFTFFLQEYRNGRTPNPDILCNKEIKFNAFLDYAKKKGADFIATGHYVRLHPDNNIRYLQKAVDLDKDQSYFLYALNHSQLTQSVFPIGHLKKTQVRILAKELRLPTYAKKDSTGICFIGKRKFKQFLQNYLPAQAGDIINIDGEYIGKHEGLMFYTIGQRQGLNIGGKKNKSQLPWYVVDKDLKENKLIVVQGRNHPALSKKTLEACQIHWINEAPSLPCTLSAKIRYRQQDEPCLLQAGGRESLQVTFEKAQRAITPGQSIVFYKGSICLGGGIIT